MPLTGTYSRSSRIVSSEGSAPTSADSTAGSRVGRSKESADRYTRFLNFVVLQPKDDRGGGDREVHPAVAELQRGAGPALAHRKVVSYASDQLVGLEALLHHFTDRESAAVAEVNGDVEGEQCGDEVGLGNPEARFPPSVARDRTLGPAVTEAAMLSARCAPTIGPRSTRRSVASAPTEPSSTSSWSSMRCRLIRC